MSESVDPCVESPYRKALDILGSGEARAETPSVEWDSVRIIATLTGFTEGKVVRDLNRFHTEAARNLRAAVEQLRLATTGGEIDTEAVERLLDLIVEPEE